MKFKFIYNKASSYGLLFLLVISCSTQKSRNSADLLYIKKSDSTSFCKPKDRFKWKEDYTLINNQWGGYKVKKGNVNICLQEFQTTSDTLFGWTFEMPKKSFGVVAYPEVYYGASFWSKKSSTPNLVQLKNIQKLQLDYKALLKTNGQKMNVAMDIWVLKDSIAMQSAIHTEIMIWEYQDNFKPNGKKIATLHTKAGDYEVRLGNINRKEMGLQWQYVAFKRLENRTQGYIPIKEMLQFLMKENIISKEYYIAAIEMGTELSNASGSIYFTEYNLQLDTN